MSTRRGKLHAGLLSAVFVCAILAIAMSGQAGTPWDWSALAAPTASPSPSLTDDDVPPAPWPRGVSRPVAGTSVRTVADDPNPVPVENDPGVYCANDLQCYAAPAVRTRQRLAVVGCVQVVQPAGGCVGSVSMLRARPGLFARLRARRGTRAAIGCAGVGAVSVSPVVNCAN